MDFFNNDTANSVQLISMPIESIGFMLTFIEVIKPDIADKIENFIDRAEIQSLSLYKKHLNKLGAFLQNGKLILAMMIFAVAWLAVGIYRTIYDLSFEQISQIFWIVSFPLIVLSFVLVYGILVSSLNSLIKFLNTFSNGKALGSIGLILAFLGLCGEIYQVLTLFFGT